MECPPPRMLAAMDAAHSSLLLSSRLKLRRDGSPYAQSILDPDLQVLDRRALQLHTGSTPLPIKSAEECVQQLVPFEARAGGDQSSALVSANAHTTS